LQLSDLAAGCVLGFEMQSGLGPIFHPMSPQAGAITGLFALVLFICGVILLIVVSSVGYCVLRCRGKDGAPEPKQVFGYRKLEMIWTTIPFAIVVFIFAMTARVMSSSDPPKNGNPDLIVIAHQWWWDVRYPAEGVHAANEIHIPTGKALLLRLESADVLHDFWVPQLSRKIHAVPGHPNEIWLEADQPGTYMGECAEYCGTQHAWMRFLVIAESPMAFDSWTRQQLQPLPANGEGAPGRAGKIFQQYTCLNCHAVSGISTNGTAAPDLTHLASRQTLGAGVLENTPDNLARWLKNPQAIKPGCLMPNFKLTDQQAQDLTDFFESAK
jgi:cytochrome c oxidase subunit 2